MSRIARHLLNKERTNKKLTATIVDVVDVTRGRQRRASKNCEKYSGFEENAKI